MSFITSGLLGGLLITGGFTPSNTEPVAGGITFGAGRPWYADYASYGEGGLKLGGDTTNAVPFGPSPSGGIRLGGNSGVVYSPSGTWNSTIIIGGLKGQSLVSSGYRLGANTYTLVGAGGVRLGGVSPRTRTSVPGSSGGFVLGGATDASTGTGMLLRNIVISGLRDGSLITGGYLQQGEINIEAATGGMSLGGVSARVYATSGIGSGGMRFGGLAPTNFPSLTVGVGGMRFGGTTVKGAALSYVVSGGTKFGGNVLVSVPNPMITASRMIIAGRIL